MPTGSGLLTVVRSGCRAVPSARGVRCRELEVSVQSYRTTAARLRHPVNVALATNAPLGVRIADATAAAKG